MREIMVLLLLLQRCRFAANLHMPLDAQALECSCMSLSAKQSNNGARELFMLGASELASVPTVTASSEV